ncbi:MAG: amidohydrolase family protein [Betaproteobacteria bacterium]
MHVIGPFDRYPLAATSPYKVPEAPLALHERMKRDVGLERTVVVTPSGYGADNRALLAALKELGPRGRGVAVIHPLIASVDLQKMNEAGVRGVRLNYYSTPQRGENERWQLFEETAARVADLGWHVQVFADAPTLASLAPAIFSSEVDVVIDHMLMPVCGKGLQQPEFQLLLDLVANNDHVWVKLAGADRVTRESGTLRDAIPYMRTLANAASDGLVWGSDWPHIGFHTRGAGGHDEVLPYRELDAGELLDLLAEAVSEEDWEAILVTNPERLYGFM